VHRIPILREGNRGFLSHSKLILGQHLKKASVKPFHILTNLSFTVSRNYMINTSENALVNNLAKPNLTCILLK
jgi:hypothetical protein